MGAMTAILLLIFKDTILGFVASIQMSVYDGACRRLDCHAEI
jgi:miniconductance mechanosensitive channel